MELGWSLNVWVPCLRMPQTPDIFSVADAAWKHPKYPCFCILSLEFVVNIDIQNMKTVKFYVQPAINHHMKCLGTPDCKYMENMLVDFIWLNAQAKYLIQTILCHFKWDMALWKWPKCSQYMKRTWWQTVATQHSGSTWMWNSAHVLSSGIYAQLPLCEKRSDHRRTIHEAW